MQASLAQHNRSACTESTDMHAHAHAGKKGKRHARRGRARQTVLSVLAQLKTQHNGKYGSAALTPDPKPPPPLPVSRRHFAISLLLPEAETRSYNTHIYSNYKERSAPLLCM